MGLPNGNGNAAIDAWLSRYAETKAGHAAAGWGALLAAWRCEAQGEHEDASRCRERAVEFWEQALRRTGDPITRIGGAADQLILAETLRRLGRFEEARDCCHRGLSGRPADPDPVGARVRDRAAERRGHRRRTPWPRCSTGGSEWPSRRSSPAASWDCAPGASESPATAIFGSAPPTGTSSGNRVGDGRKRGASPDRTPPVTRFRERPAPAASTPFTRTSDTPASTSRCSGRADPLSPEQDALLELDQVIGLVEACGRIEVHESGFRAERARPAVLLVGKRWSAIRRRGVERVARQHGAEVLEIGQAEELVEYCERRGGALDPESVAELLEPVDAARESFDEGGSASTSLPPPPPAEPEGRARRILHGVGHAVYVGFLGLFIVLWYGMWAAVVISIAGAILFGWGDEKPWKAPARVERVLADRSKCRVEAVVRARRPVQRLHLGIVGIRDSGERIRACDPRRRAGAEGNIDGPRRGDDAAAVPIAGAVHGPHSRGVRGEGSRSRRPDHLRADRPCQEDRLTTDPIKAMTLPGPSRTIIVEPIEQPETSPAEPATEPAEEPNPEPAEPVPEPEREKEPARTSSVSGGELFAGTDRGRQGLEYLR